MKLLKEILLKISWLIIITIIAIPILIISPFFLLFDEEDY